jgi:hypothetical protein
LFHAGSALGLHPSELSPLKQPAHLSMTRALLTLTRHRLHQRPARTPLLDISLQQSRCNDLVTAPSSAAGRSRQRLEVPLSGRQASSTNQGPQSPPRRLRPARLRVTFPGPKPRSSSTAVRLAASGAFDHPALP